MQSNPSHRQRTSKGNSDDFYFPAAVNLPEPLKRPKRKVSPPSHDLHEMFTSLPMSTANDIIAGHQNAPHLAQQRMTVQQPNFGNQGGQESGRFFQNTSDSYQQEQTAHLLPENVSQYYRYNLNKTMQHTGQYPTNLKLRNRQNLDLADVGGNGHMYESASKQFMTPPPNSNAFQEMKQYQTLVPFDHARDDNKVTRNKYNLPANLAASSSQIQQKRGTSLPPLQQSAPQQNKDQQKSFLQSNKRGGSIQPNGHNAQQVPKLNLSVSPSQRTVDPSMLKSMPQNSSVINDIIQKVQQNSSSRSKLANMMNKSRPSLPSGTLNSTSLKPLQPKNTSSNRFQTRTSSIPTGMVFNKTQYQGGHGVDKSHSLLPASIMLKSQEQLQHHLDNDDQSESATPIKGVPVPDHIMEKFNIQPLKSQKPVDPRDKWIARMAFKYSPRLRQDPSDKRLRVGGQLTGQRSLQKLLSPKARQSKMSNPASRLSRVSLGGAVARQPPNKLKLANSGSESQIKGQIAEVNQIIKQMKQYSSQIKGLIKKPDEVQEESQQEYFERDAYTPIDEEQRMRLSDQSSIWHLASYRSLLMSQLSRDEVISSLKIVKLPEVFSDPPVFSIKNFIRDFEEDADEIKRIKDRYEGSIRPQRTKPLLDDFLLESELDPTRTVCFTTNSNLVYNSVKLVDQHLNWYFTKSQNVNMFHLQFQQTESQLVKSQNKIDYQMVIQNHFKAGTNALRELYASEIKATNWINPSKGTFENYLCTKEGFPIYLRQLVFISSLFPAKVYGFQHRYFEVEGVEHLMAQSELQSIFPYKQFPVFDISGPVQMIIDTLQRKVKMSERSFQFVELRFLIHKTLMKPTLARLDTTLSLEVRIPDQCIIPLLFKIDHLVRSQLHLEPNTTIRHKEMFRQYWKKIIDQEENQTELASMEAISAFAAGIDHKIEVKYDEIQSFAVLDLQSNVNKGKESAFAESSSSDSDLTVLPEEVALISIGSDDSETAKLRKMKAVMRKKDLHAQQKAYMAFMAQFYPHDAHIKTHREFIEDQKRRMKAIYRIQKYHRHHTRMRLLQEHIKRVIASKRIIRQKIAAINLRRNLDGRRQLKNKLQKAAGFWKVRRAVNMMIERRRKAKAMILRFVRRWQARKAEERALLEAKKKGRKKSKRKGKDKKGDKKKKGKDGKDDKKKSGRKSGLKDDDKKQKKDRSANTSRDRVSPLSMADDKRDKKGKKESRTERSGKRTEVDQSLVIHEEAKEGDDDGTKRRDKKSKRAAADEESKEQPATDRKGKRDRKERSPDLGDDQQNEGKKESSRRDKKKSSRKE